MLPKLFVFKFDEYTTDGSNINFKNVHHEVILLLSVIDNREYAERMLQNMTDNSYGPVAYYINRLYSAMVAPWLDTPKLWVRFPLPSTIPGSPGWVAF